MKRSVGRRRTATAQIASTNCCSVCVRPCVCVSRCDWEAALIGRYIELKRREKKRQQTLERFLLLWFLSRCQWSIRTKIRPTEGEKNPEPLGLLTCFYRSWHTLLAEISSIFHPPVSLSDEMPWLKYPSDLGIKPADLYYSYLLLCTVCVLCAFTTPRSGAPTVLMERPP